MTSGDHTLIRPHSTIRSSLVPVVIPKRNKTTFVIEYSLPFSLPVPGSSTPEEELLRQESLVPVQFTWDTHLTGDLYSFVSSTTSHLPDPHWRLHVP